MTTIRKALITAYGDSSVIEVVETTIRPPAGNAVQVRIVYAGFAGADVNQRVGKYPLQRSPPLTPGYSFIGRVVSTGPACKKEWVAGTVVTAITVYDSDAELINISERYLVPVPVALAASDDGMQQVPGLALDWATAYGMVERAAAVRPGQRVFVHGLSGAVGYAVMIICLRHGATVYGTASARNHATLREKGAIPFVYTDKAWMEAMRKAGGAHVVFDPLGFESWDESYAILDSGGGILVGYGGNKATLEGELSRIIYPWILRMLAWNLNIFSRKSTTFYYLSRDSKHYEPDFRAVMDLCADGEIKVPIKKVFELETDSLREAHDSWGKLPGVGSMVVRVN